MRAAMAFVGRDEEVRLPALDTPDGRSSKAASALRMHRGYDMVVAGLPGAVPAFAEAFDCSEKRILPLGLLVSITCFPPSSKTNALDASVRAVERLDIDRDRWRAVVLYAPTLRRGVAGRRCVVRSLDGRADKGFRRNRCGARRGRSSFAG